MRPLRAAGHLTGARRQGRRDGTNGAGRAAGWRQGRSPSWPRRIWPLGRQPGSIRAGRACACAARSLNEGGGRLAQLVEHLAYTERVGGSIPSPPTNRINVLARAPD